MQAAKTKKRRQNKKKHCPVCNEEVSMAVAREAEGDSDLWCLCCSVCNSAFMLTKQQYQKEKKPDISAVNIDKAKPYNTKDKYKIGQLIYHKKLDDVGVVVEKISPPSNVSCSGTIVVSFVRGGQKMLIEGYAVA